MVKNIQVANHQSNIPSCALLNDKFNSGCLDIPRSLQFKELGTHVYGFREGLFPLGRLAILHGILIFDLKNNRVTVKGFLDWTVLSFVFIWLMVPLLAWLLGYLASNEQIFDEPVWLVAAAYFGLVFVNLVIFYLSTYFRFSAVASFAAQAWS